MKSWLSLGHMGVDKQWSLLTLTGHFVYRMCTRILRRREKSAYMINRGGGDEGDVRQRAIDPDEHAGSPPPRFGEWWRLGDLRHIRITSRPDEPSLHDTS